MKTLAWLLGVCVIVGAIIFVAHKQHDAREKAQREYHEQCARMAISLEDQHACTQQAQSRKEYLPWGYELVTWPEGITTWAVVGTLIAIAWQSSETRKAAEAALAQTNLQSASMRQWLEISGITTTDKGGLRSQKFGTAIPSRLVDLKFDVVNRTPYPLTLHKVSTTLRILKSDERHTFEYVAQIRLTPGGARGNSFGFIMRMVLSDDALRLYNADSLTFGVDVAADFVPAVGKNQVQNYMFVVKMGVAEAIVLPMQVVMTQTDKGTAEG